MRNGLFWTHWNQIVIAHERVRIEDVTAETVLRLARIANPDATAGVLPPTTTNTSGKKLGRTIEWEDIAHVPGLMDQARAYGYGDQPGDQP